MHLYQIKTTLLIFLWMVFFTSWGSAQDLYKEREIEVSLRLIGDELLLSLGDTTSRVLPIVKEKDHYKIQFESEFEFTPEQLVLTIDRVAKQTKLANKYVVFMIDNLTKTDIIPCKARVQPKSCYNLLFTLIAVDGKTAFYKPASKFVAEIRWIYYTLPSLLVLMAIVSFFMWKRKNKPKNDSNLIPLGAYYFDKRNTALLIEHQSIELTSKEADLLFLLYSAVNTTVQREILLNEVWGDEGGYVGRTLDVFISKLRKKLKFDPNVKIVNIRGVGYKLIMND